MCLLAPNPNSRAKFAKTLLDSSVLTYGRIHALVSPLLGCTNAYNHNHLNLQLTLAIGASPSGR
jgi:hypothetical protein